MKNDINDFRNASDKAADDNGLLFRMLKYLNLSMNGEETEEFTDSEKVKNKNDTPSVEDFIREMESHDDVILEQLMGEMKYTYERIELMGVFKKSEIIEAMDHFEKVISQVDLHQPISEELQSELDQLLEDTIDRNKQLTPEEIEKFEKMKKVAESLRGKVSEIAKNPETTEVNLAEIVPEEEKEQTQEYLREAFGSYYSAKIERTIKGRNAYTKMQPYFRTPKGSEKKIFRPAPGTEEHVSEVIAKKEMGPLVLDGKEAEREIEAGGTIENVLEHQTEEFTGLGVPSKEVLDEIEEHAGEGIHIKPADAPKTDNTATLEEHPERDIVEEETKDEVEAQVVGEDFLPGVEPTMEITMEELEEERVAEPAEEPSVETELEETERVVTEEETVEEVKLEETEGQTQEVPTQDAKAYEQREEEQRAIEEENIEEPAQEPISNEEKPGFLQSITNAFKGFINRFTRPRLDEGKTEETSTEVLGTETKNVSDNKWQLQGEELAAFRDKESQVISDQKKTVEEQEKTGKNGPDKNTDEMQI